VRVRVATASRLLMPSCVHDDEFTELPAQYIDRKDMKETTAHFNGNTSDYKGENIKQPTSLASRRQNASLRMTE